MNNLINWLNSGGLTLLSWKYHKAEQMRRMEVVVLLPYLTVTR
jgi:hypothetical protein